MRVPLPLVVASLVAATGILLAFAAPEPSHGLRAQLFSGPPPTLCMEVDEQDRIEGRLGSQALLPGTAVRGSVLLTRCDNVPGEVLDLDIGFDPEVDDVDPPSVPDLGHLLLIEALAYGADDLLKSEPGRPGDRDLILEIDRHPLRGNGDGKLSLWELEAGINDLPAPGMRNAPTLFVMDVVLVDQSGNELQGDTASLDIRFFLSDRANQDLN